LRTAFCAAISQSEKTKKIYVFLLSQNTNSFANGFLRRDLPIGKNKKILKTDEPHFADKNCFTGIH
jgi:hypothetical protein